MADTIASTGLEEDPHALASQPTGVEEGLDDAASINSSTDYDSTEEAEYEKAERLGIRSAHDDDTPLPKHTRKKQADEI